MLTSRWQVGTALYILGLISYQGALTCKYHHRLGSYLMVLPVWTAAFPGLARDLPEVKASEESLSRGETRSARLLPGITFNEVDTSFSQKAHDTLDMLTRNRLANISFFVCSVGELVVLAILAGILEGIITSDPDSNTRALSIVCAYSAGVWSTFKPFYPIVVMRLI